MGHCKSSVKGKVHSNTGLPQETRKKKSYINMNPPRVDGGAWQAAVHGVAKSQTRLSDFTFTFHFHALEKGKICIETNENENTTTQNLWDTVKAVLRGRFIAIQAYLKKQEKSQINNLTLHLKQLEKEEMKNTRVSRRKEILKIRAEINAKETKEPIAKINKAKSWLFERIY